MRKEEEAKRKREEEEKKAKEAGGAERGAMKAGAWGGENCWLFACQQGQQQIDHKLCVCYYNVIAFIVHHHHHHHSSHVYKQHAPKTQISFHFSLLCCAGLPGRR